jgi:hypothetical protein
MKPPSPRLPAVLFASLLICCAVCAADTGSPDPWQQRHDRLVLRLRNLAPKENAFGADYQPIGFVA